MLRERDVQKKITGMFNSRRDFCSLLIERKQMVERLTTHEPPCSMRSLPSTCSGDQWSSTMRRRTSEASSGSESLLLGLHAPCLASALPWAAMAHSGRGVRSS